MANKPQLLVVDDDQGVVEPLCEFLAQQGYRVECASDGVEALEWLRSAQGPPSAILLDLVMPRMTGTEFLEERRRDPRLAEIPVVVMTARRDFEQPRDVAGVLHKPLLPSAVVTLLKQLPQTAPVSSAKPTSEPESSDRDRHLVMVVEDQRDVREQLQELLRMEGYATCGAATGREALDRLQDTAARLPDALLLDLRMPDMDGWQFRLRQRQDLRLATIPVIVISGDSSPQAATIHADAYLPKPIAPGALTAALEKILANRERQEGRVARLSQVDRLASLGTLVAGVAHEINNPLAYIISNLEFTLRELTPNTTAAALAEIRECMAEARDGANRIRQIVRDLKSFGRVEAEKREPVDLHRVLDFACTVVDNQMRHRARLTKDLQPVERVSADEGKLGQVFINLLLNAAQAIPEGAADRNEIRVTSRSVGPKRVAVEVKDTGTGISPEHLARIFDPFFTTKPIGQGTGLGLSISHGIVSSYGGEIQVESELGKGTTFRILLPSVGDQTATAVATPQRSVVTRGGRRPRILVLDDEPLIGTVIRRTLRDQFDVEVVARAQDAFDLLENRGPFDAIFCDMMMPVVSGIEFYRELKQRSPQQASRVVFVTGGTFTPESTAFLDEVQNPVLEKPFGLDEIHHALDAVLDLRN